MLSLHTHQPLLVQLHATLYYRRNNSTSTTTDPTTNPFHSHKLPPTTFAADTVIPSPSYDSPIIDSYTALNPYYPSSLSLTTTTINSSPISSPSPTSNSSSTTSTTSSTPPDLFLRSLDSSCLARVRAMTRHTAFRFEKHIDYEVERAFVWAGVGGAEGEAGVDMEGMGMGMAGMDRMGRAGMGMARMGMEGMGMGMEGMGGMGIGIEGMGEDKGSAARTGTGTGTGVGAVSGLLSMRGLSSAEIARQVDMMRRRGYRDWVRVDMAVEIEVGRELREREEVGRWVSGVQNGEAEGSLE
ncbi:hypothetical protein B0I37DRAFT_419472 [Chaetomium sp. MPI-CAGE-AT-0009]|nr:hypothetical protein B0I37DRAFT_419472 [Chaetomium sp. MPI-CAGE-AT-0009]